MEARFSEHAVSKAVCLVDLPDVGFWPCVKARDCHEMHRILESADFTGYQPHQLAIWYSELCSTPTASSPGLPPPQVVLPLGPVGAPAIKYHSIVLPPDRVKRFTDFVTVEFSPQFMSAICAANELVEEPKVPKKRPPALERPHEPETSQDWQLCLLKQEDTHWPCIVCNNYRTLHEVAEKAKIDLVGFSDWYRKELLGGPWLEPDYRLGLLLGVGQYSVTPDPHFVVDPQGSYVSRLTNCFVTEPFANLFQVTTGPSPELTVALGVAHRLSPLWQSRQSPPPTKQFAKRRPQPDHRPLNQRNKRGRRTPRQPLHCPFSQEEHSPTSTPEPTPAPISHNYRHKPTWEPLVCLRGQEVEVWSPPFGSLPYGPGEARHTMPRFVFDAICHHTQTNSTTPILGRQPIREKAPQVSLSGHSVEVTWNNNNSETIKETSLLFPLRVFRAIRACLDPSHHEEPLHAGTCGPVTPTHATAAKVVPFSQDNDSQGIVAAPPARVSLPGSADPEIHLSPRGSITYRSKDYQGHSAASLDPSEEEDMSEEEMLTQCHTPKRNGTHRDCGTEPPASSTAIAGAHSLAGTGPKGQTLGTAAAAAASDSFAGTSPIATSPLPVPPAPPQEPSPSSPLSTPGTGHPSKADDRCPSGATQEGCTEAHGPQVVVVAPTTETAAPISKVTGTEAPTAGQVALVPQPTATHRESTTPSSANPPFPMCQDRMTTQYLSSPKVRLHVEPPAPPAPPATPATPAIKVGIGRAQE